MTLNFSRLHIGPFSVDAGRTERLTFGVRLNGHGQQGLFLSLGWRVLWVRVTPTGLRGFARVSRLGFVR